MASPHRGPAGAARITRDIRGLLAMAAEAQPELTVHVHDVGRIAIMLVMPAGPYARIPLFFTIEPGVQFAGTTAPYPAAPPRVLHYSPHHVRIHPNLYRADQTGKVCLSILGTWSGPGWTSLMTFEQIVTMIAALLHDESLRCEPGFEHGKADIVAKHAHSLTGTLPRTTLQLMHNIIVLGKQHEITLRGHSATTLDLAEFREELTILFLRYADHYETIFESHPDGAPHVNMQDASGHFASVKAELLALREHLAARSLRKVAIDVYTSLPVQTVTTMCIAGVPHRDVRVYDARDDKCGLSNDKPELSNDKPDLVLVVGTDEDSKKYPGAVHVPSVGTPQHIMEHIRSHIAGTNCKVLM